MNSLIYMFTYSTISTSEPQKVFGESLSLFVGVSEKETMEERWGGKEKRKKDAIEKEGNDR